MSRIALALLLISSLALATGQQATPAAPPTGTLKLEGQSPMPRLVNARLQHLNGAQFQAALDGLMRANAGPLWIGYAIPVERKERTMCCFDNWDEYRSRSGCCMGCRLESRGGNSFEGTTDDSNCKPLEPSAVAFIFLRGENHQLTKVRTFSTDCGLDAEGLPVYWMDGVPAPQSVAYLAGLARAEIAKGENYKKSLGVQAVRAVALHDDASADKVLEELLRPETPSWIRREAALFTGLERGKAGLAILRTAMKLNSADDKFREQALIGFSQSNDRDGLKDLIEIGRTDPSPKVRGQAIFWLAQAGGRKEAEQITDAIENDPDSQVKKRAVFALSQMPEGEGVTQLINLAKNNKNPVVRKEAIRWLGQTHDPRALDFLEQLLMR